MIGERTADAASPSVRGSEVDADEATTGAIGGLTAPSAALATE